MPIKGVEMTISKKIKMRFFLKSQGSCNPKIRFLDQKVCPVARTQTHRPSDYFWHPFRVSGFFPFNLSSRIGPITRSWFGAMVLLDKINQFPGLIQKQLCVAHPKQYFQKKKLIRVFLAVTLCRHPCCVVKGYISSIPRRKNVGLSHIIWPVF